MISSSPTRYVLWQPRHLSNTLALAGGNSHTDAFVFRGVRVRFVAQLVDFEAKDVHSGEKEDLKAPLLIQSQTSIHLDLIKSCPTCQLHSQKSCFLCRLESRRKLRLCKTKTSLDFSIVRHTLPRRFAESRSVTRETWEVFKLLLTKPKICSQAYTQKKQWSCPF